MAHLFILTWQEGHKTNFHENTSHEATTVKLSFTSTKHATTSLLATFTIDTQEYG